jgi:hypothetical protein
MGNFSKTFDRYVAEDPSKLLDPISEKQFVRSSAATRSPQRTDAGRGRAGMRADSLSRILENAEGSLIASGRVEAALTKLARELIRDPKDGVKTLKRWSKKAKSDPYKALAALSTFGEVLKRAVALLERIPEKFGSELGANNVSVTIDLPRSIAISFSWAVAPPAAPPTATAV